MSQGVQFVSAGKLTAWRKKNASRKKMWSPEAPNCTQTHKLKTQITVKVRTLPPAHCVMCDCSQKKQKLRLAAVHVIFEI